MSDRVQSEKEDMLGTEFWTQPDALHPNFAFIYASFSSALREEVRERGGSAIEYAIAERLAFSYAWLRQRENAELDMTDRNRRELNKDFLETSMALRKMWGVEDSKNATEAVLRKVDKAPTSAMSEMPAEQAKALQKNLADSLAAAGL